MTANEIYVALLDEGVDVWRPVPAHPVGGNAYVVLCPDDYDPDVEHWEFPPGSIVQCEHRSIRDGNIFAAVKRIAVPTTRSA